MFSNSESGDAQFFRNLGVALPFSYQSDYFCLTLRQIRHLTCVVLFWIVLLALGDPIAIGYQTIAADHSSSAANGAPCSLWSSGVSYRARLSLVMFFNFGWRAYLLLSSRHGKQYRKDTIRCTPAPRRPFVRNGRTVVWTFATTFYRWCKIAESPACALSQVYERRFSGITTRQHG
jgi:hypothetical protein